MTDEMIPLFKVLMAPGAEGMVAEVLHSGQIAQGRLVDRFELELANLLELVHPGDQPPLTVNSGTSALHLAYQLAGVSPGDVVIATPMTCSATISPLVHLGAELVWADVDPVTGNIDPKSVANLVEVYTDSARKKAGAPMLKAVVAVDWAGRPAPYADMRAFVPAKIPIIEDAAHAMLARRDGTPGRAIAPLGRDYNMFVCFSTQAIKHLTTGDGGILVCPTTDLTDRARKLRWFGFDRTSSQDFRCAQDITEAGHKFHMNDIAAAIGLANLPRVHSAVERHRANAKRYCEALGDLAPCVTIPPWDPGSSWWLYTILVSDRASFEAFMKERGIATSQVHRRNDEHTAFQKATGGRVVALPGLEHFSARQVSIPVGWWLTSSDMERITDAVRTWASRG